jgi:hypothetical protein
MISSSDPNDSNSFFPELLNVIGGDLNASKFTRVMSSTSGLEINQESLDNMPPTLP